MAPDLRIRLWIFERLRDTGAAPRSSEIAAAFALPEAEARAALARLAGEHDAIVLDDAGEVWMAEPFSAVPTGFRVRCGARAWWGNCIWDALAILSLLDVDGRVETRCPDSGEELVVGVESGALVEPAGGAVVHFAVPAADWWRDVGYT